MSETRVYDLLAEWEELRQRGESPSAEQLCPDDPVVREELRRRIRRQQQVRALIEPPDPLWAGPPVPEVDGYDLLDVIGSGGMGIVYRARQRGLDRVVALKMILTGGADAQGLARFREEARAVAALQHPHIVQVFEAGEANGRPFLALEYIPGGSLAGQLNGAPVGPRRAAEAVAVLAGAVQHAHDRGIVHRDLKPANVLVAPDGTLKVTDFGLAKRLDDEAGLTRTGMVVGSPSYMPPEQAAGDTRAVGPTTDVYALGAMLYELLTGRPPFVGETVMETIRQLIDYPPAAPRALQPAVPKDLEVVCLHCLEKRPEDRYPTAQALADDLRRFLAGEPIQARPPSVLGMLARNVRRGNYNPAFGSYSRWLLTLAPIPLLAHLAVYFGLPHDRHFPFVMTAASLTIVLVMQLVLHLVARPVAWLVPPAMRRHFVTVWSAEFIGMALLWFLVWAVVPPDHPELMYLVYPLWAYNLGKTYLAFASEAGVLYVQGGAFFALAGAFVFVLPWTPLIVGALIFVNGTVSGLLLRKVAARTGPAPPPAGHRSTG